MYCFVNPTSATNIANTMTSNRQKITTTKVLLTKDNVSPISYDGIKQKYVLDWLLEE